MNIKAENLHEAVALLNQNRINLTSALSTASAPESVKAITDNAQEKRNAVSVLVSMIYQSMSEKNMLEDMRISLFSTKIHINSNILLVLL
jgi:hypothetical protein